MRHLFAACFALLPFQAQACDLALALAVDISGSVDPEEYDIQMKGLALALQDSIVSEALVRAEAAVMLVQWTGSSRQAVSVPWTRIHSFDDAKRVASLIENAPREWRNFSTAIGDALQFTVDNWENAPDCKRKVIDVSGDGIDYFFENVIRGEGAFVVTANTFEDYPERIRQKLIRETTAQISCLGC